MKNNDNTLTEQLAKFREIRDFFLIKKKLKPTAIFSLLFGIIALINGINLLSENEIFIILSVVGLLLIINGINLLIKPNHIALFINGIAFISVGIWNFGTSVIALDIFWIILGISQVSIGYKTIKKYQWFKDFTVKINSNEFIKQISKSIASQISPLKYEEEWIVRISNKYRPMKIEEYTLNLDTIIENIAKQKFTVDRIVICHPNEDKFVKLGDIAEFSPIVQILISELSI